MQEKILFFSMCLVFGLVFSAFAQQGQEGSQPEEISITTYYPSPYGSYNELQTNRLAIGDADGDGQLDDGDQPNRDGDIRLKAQSDDPATWPAGREGQFAYSSSEDALYHYNKNLEWVKSVQGPVTTISLKCAWTGNPTTCTPPPCPSGWTETNNGPNYVSTGAVGVLGSYGWSERICEINKALAIISSKCAIIGSANCIPGQPCPPGWTQLGIGNAYLGNEEGWQRVHGYGEKICGKE